MFLNRFRESLFSRKIAISPPRTDLLRLLASVFDRQPGEQSPIAPPAGQANLVPPPAILAPPTVTQVFFYAGWVMGKLWINYGDLFHYMTSVETHDDWTVVSSNNEIRKSTFAKLTKEDAEAAPQVRLRMKSLRGAEVEPYIQAHTYLAARRVSSENARFLNDFAQWTHLSATDAREIVENLLNARICCPLGGDFEVKGGSEHPRWVGTEVYPDSPASRAGLRLGDTIQTVDRQRPRSHSQLVQLLRAALERDGVAVVQVLRRGVIHRFRIPLLDR